MSVHAKPLATAFLAATMAVVPFPSAGFAGQQEWRFDVLLDGRRIGYHHFRLAERGDTHELISEARFNVRFLFIDAYRYAHDAREVWRGACLERIEARTDDNGRRRSVQGTKEDGTFVVRTSRDRQALPQCVRSFAYWNRGILGADRLLNAQTGAYVSVSIVPLGRESIGPDAHASRYRIRSVDEDVPLEIDLWYGDDGRWLALASRTEDGRQLEYRLQ